MPDRARQASPRTSFLYLYTYTHTRAKKQKKNVRWRHNYPIHKNPTYNKKKHLAHSRFFFLPRRMRTGQRKAILAHSLLSSRTEKSFFLFPVYVHYMALCGDTAGAPVSLYCFKTDISSLSSVAAGCYSQKRPR